MTLERLFLDHLDVIDQAVRFVARRHLLSDEESEELAASVRLKIIENDYDVLKKFEGRSSLRTYLTAVVQRHFLDLRIARWGKWRPSLRARHFGPVGLLLDQYVSRDGLTVDEAVERVLAHQASTLSRRELQRMADSLPIRAPRRFVSDGELHEAASDAAAPDFGVLEQEDAARTDRLLAEALGALDSDERLLLRLRFQQGLQVAQIARLTGLEQKALYRRIENLMKRLRRDLEARGVSASGVTAIIGRPDVNFTALDVDRLETATKGPSLR